MFHAGHNLHRLVSLPSPHSFAMCPFVLLLSVLLGYLDLTSGSKIRKPSSSSASAASTFLRTTVAPLVDVDFTFLFEPEMIDNVDAFHEWDDKLVVYNVTASCCVSRNATLSVSPLDPRVADVTQNSTTDLVFDSAAGGGNRTLIAFGSFLVKGRRLGKTELIIKLTYRNADPKEPGSTVIEGPPYGIIVLRERRVVDDMFRYGIIILAAFLYIGFGCKLELRIIWDILKKPISPAIGFGCQFIIMPLLGFGISRMLNLSDELSFGLLAMSTSPGGGSSNVWVSLLGGHLDLSLTMTTISTFGSLVMMPMWMYFLGRMFVDPNRLSIPYVVIVRSLLTIIVPLLVGLLIKRFAPKVAKLIARFTRPFSGIFVIYILTFGTYVNFYMYIIMGTQPNVIIAAILLPLLGYSLAFAISMAFKRSMKNTVAISIETGVQNASIPIIMLQGNFKQPEGDIAAVMPVATSLFTQFPIMFAWIAVIIYRRMHPKLDLSNEENDVKSQPVELIEVKLPVDDEGATEPLSKIGRKASESVANGVCISRPPPEDTKF